MSKSESLKNNVSKNIMLVGQSGQGISLASDVIVSVCAAAGYEIKTEGGNGPTTSSSVCRHFRYGKQVETGTINKSEADILLSFDLLESMRWLDYLSDEGLAIVNSQSMVAPARASAKAKLPGRVIDVLKVRAKKLEMVDGLTLGKKVGNLRMLNIILLGVLSRYLEFDEELWRTAIANRVPAKTVEKNLKAFELGRKQQSN